MIRTSPLGHRCTVVIRLRSLSKGTSAIRGSPAFSPPGSRPSLPAAVSSAASVGSPTAVQTSWFPAGGRSAASLHKATAVSSRSHRARRLGEGAGRARVTSPAGPYPEPSISASPSGVHSCRATMLPSVRVPVLSVPSTVTEPSVSTAGSRLIRAFRADIRRAPRASARVTTAGRDSGTAATTKLIAVMTISSSGCPRTSPRARTTAHSPTAPTASARPSPTRRRCSGVSPGRPPISAAICPNELAAPVAVTTARPRPRTTPCPPTPHRLRHPGRSRPCPPERIPRSGRTRPRAASPRPRCRHRPGTMSPSASTNRSPTTTSAAGISCCSPSRTTRASGAASSDRAAIALPAFTSWATPTAVFTTITSKMTEASVQSPVATVSTAAASSTRLSGSRS